MYMQEMTLSLPCVRRMVSVDVLDSTQNLARELLQQGCEANTLVLAYEQTNACEKNGRTGRGGVYFTLILRPRELLPHPEQFAARAAQAVAEALQNLFRFKTKTTNAHDVCVWDGEAKSWKKTGNVSAEVSTGADKTLWVLLSVCVHVNDKFPVSLPACSCVKKLLGREIDPEWVLQETLEAFWRRYAPSQFASLRQ